MQAHQPAATVQLMTMSIENKLEYLQQKVAADIKQSQDVRKMSASERGAYRSTMEGHQSELVGLFRALKKVASSGSEMQKYLDRAFIALNKAESKQAASTGTSTSQNRASSLTKNNKASSSKKKKAASASKKKAAAPKKREAAPKKKAALASKNQAASASKNQAVATSKGGKKKLSGTEVDLNSGASAKKSRVVTPTSIPAESPTYPHLWNKKGVAVMCGSTCGFIRRDELHFILFKTPDSMDLKEEHEEETPVEGVNGKWHVLFGEGANTKETSLVPCKDVQLMSEMTRGRSRTVYK